MKASVMHDFAEPDVRLSAFEQGVRHAARAATVLAARIEAGDEPSRSGPGALRLLAERLVPVVEVADAR